MASHVSAPNFFRIPLPIINLLPKMASWFTSTVLALNKSISFFPYTGTGPEVKAEYAAFRHFYLRLLIPIALG